jgi:amino acid adenylation domain-containing protein
MTSEVYPTIEDYSYPYLYYKEDSFNSQITKHYAKMSHMIKQYAQSKRMKLLAFNHITYRELNEKSNQLARTLESKGVECGQVVGLMFENSIEMMVSILAVLKLRGIYLPIDPTYPDSAIEYFIKNSGMKIILTQQNFLTKVNTQKFSLLEEAVVVDNDIYKGDSSNLNLDYKLDDLAYLIYTSGTTGRPKGTLIEQKSITNYTKWRINNYKITKDDNSIQLLSYCFDGFGSNVYSTLLSGGTLVIIPESKRMDFSFIKEVIQYSDVTNISMVPSMFQRLIDYSQNGDLDSLRFIVMAGEKGSKELLKKIKEKRNNLLIINEYGPTEATVTATAKFDLSEDSVTNIGKPIGNVKIYVLDKSQRILPVDVPGELYIGGMGLARGYHNNFELTREKFIQNPYNEKEKLYRTGDIVKWLPDGNIEYLGRTDNQVKVRGYRIELNEIEKLLQGHEEIKEVVVIDKENKMGEVSLYAFFVLKDTTKELLASEIRKYLSILLPDYMIPSYFTKLENIPLNPNGKADLKALKMIEVNINSEAEFVSPQDSLEESIASIWKEVLEIEKVGRNDNFFDLGGNSLNILRINNEIKIKMGLDIPIVTLFNYPTISSLSQHLEKDERKEIFTQSDSDRLAKGKNKLKNLRSKTGSIR